MTPTPPPAAAPPLSRRTMPNPPTASPVRASAGQRIGAYLIDIAAVAVVAAAVWVLSGSPLLLAVAVIELWAIGWIWEGHTGGSPGSLALGIRTVRRGSEVTVGAPGLLLRSLLMGAAHIVPVALPAVLAATGALDGVAGAQVIDVRRTRAAQSAGVRAPSLDARVSGGDLITSTPLDRGQRDPAMQPALGAGAQAAGAAATAPAAAPAQASPAPALIPAGASTVPVFELSDGTVIRATGLGFIGRAPRAPESVQGAILVRVPDGARSLSRTHAAFGIEDGDLWVQDLGSANGASVRHLGGGVTDLASQTPYFLVPGDVLVLGGAAELAFRRVVERAEPPEREQRPTPDAVPSASAPTTPPPAAAPTGAVPAAIAPTDQATVALQFQDGTTVGIRGIGYIGRAPSLPDGERPDAVLVTVPDGDRSVSRTHGRFGVAGGQAWFEDLGSGNGSMLHTDDGRSGPMTPHQRFSLVPGMVLRLGDCVIRIVAG
ncbi:FHA domain-containing protein [Microbacterium soli]|uniref:FHA domain-containing protein n=1 Tax=Microbacterium soli TaxID=446075 RepID=A0ABP7MY91_9MICO